MCTVTEMWERIAQDLRSTTGRTLHLRLRPTSDGLWKIEVELDGIVVSRGQRVFLETDTEEALAELADYLQEAVLDEEVWGGWPICPDHRTHPLEATTDQTHIAVWKCPRGRVIARIGDLTNEHASDAVVNPADRLGVAKVNESPDHVADHVAVRDAMDGWDFDPDAQNDLLRVNLTLHLGAFHGWTVAVQGGVLGLVPMLVEHDRSHLSVDVLGIEQFLQPVIIDAIRQAESEPL